MILSRQCLASLDAITRTPKVKDIARPVEVLRLLHESLCIGEIQLKDLSAMFCTTLRKDNYRVPI